MISGANVLLDYISTTDTFLRFLWGFSFMSIDNDWNVEFQNDSSFLGFTIILTDKSNGKRYKKEHCSNDELYYYRTAYLPFDVCSIDEITGIVTHYED